MPTRAKQEATYLLEVLEQFGVNKSFGIFMQRAVDGDDVALVGKEVCSLKIRGAEALWTNLAHELLQVLNATSVNLGGGLQFKVSFIDGRYK